MQPALSGEGGKKLATSGGVGKQIIQQGGRVWQMLIQPSGRCGAGVSKIPHSRSSRAGAEHFAADGRGAGDGQIAAAGFHLLPDLGHPFEHVEPKYGISPRSIDDVLRFGREICSCTAAHSLAMCGSAKFANVHSGVTISMSACRSARIYLGPLMRAPSFAAGHRLIIVTWLPLALKVTSSMKVRIKSSPRPLTFSRFSGSVGSGSFEGSKPGPWSRMTKRPLVGVTSTVTSSCRLA